METMYQRSRIQEESLHYETLKHSGEYEIIGVNTFLSKDGSPTIIPEEVIRATEEEKKVQLCNLKALHTAMSGCSADAINQVQEAAVSGGNIFEELIEASKVASLGQITDAMFHVGGAYRRNM